MGFSLEVPVVFCTFNRLDTAIQVFEKIREAKPPRLYVISDAPRDTKPNEAEQVNEVRRYIEESIDWECELHKDYATINMGCGRRISSGLSNVFEKEEQAIILEDDCVPDSSFFEYCQTMLKHYRDEEQIMLIAGNNPIASCYQAEYDYSFSTIPFIWGWATWARAWNNYDFDILDWPSQRENRIWKKIFTKKAYWLYMSEFDELYHHRFNIWSYQILYMMILRGQLCVVPSESHVLNIGFLEESTTTKKMPAWMSQNIMPVRFPIAHPPIIERDVKYDTIYMNQFCRNGLIVRIKKLLGLNINKSIFDR